MMKGPYTHFGIIDLLDENRDYAKFEDNEKFQDKLDEHHCISVADDIINAWWDRLLKMKSYYHVYSRPSTALARWGVTLLPPESLDFFHSIIVNDTASEFVEECADDLARLLDLVKLAKKENKYVIHYGV